MEIAVREKAEPFAPVIVLLLLLVGAAVFGLYLGWALMAGAILFTLDAKRHGRTWEQVGNMLAQGLKKAWIVVQVLLVIGLLTASWISCAPSPAWCVWGLWSSVPTSFSSAPSGSALS